MSSGTGIAAISKDKLPKVVDLLREGLGLPSLDLAMPKSRPCLEDLARQYRGRLKKKGISPEFAAQLGRVYEWENPLTWWRLESAVKRRWR